MKLLRRNFGWITAALVLLSAAMAVSVVACGDDDDDDITDDDTDDDTDDGCISNDDCGTFEYCAKEVAQCDDGAGMCKEAPDNCDTDYSPVCGCDGITYSNECVAAGSMVNVSYRGECGSTITSDS